MKFILWALCIVVWYVIVYHSCADAMTLQQAIEATKVGFWSGLWEGTIFLSAFILSLFFDEVAVYAINNNGGWYDFGFWLGIAIGVKIIALGGDLLNGIWK